MPIRRLLAALITMAGVGLPVAANADNIVTGVSNLGTLSTPQTLNYGHAFNDLDPGTAGLQLPGGITLNATDVFYDDYAFTIDGSSFSTIAATLDLGQFFSIANLQVRLFRGTPGTVIAGVQPWSSALTAQGTGTGQIQVIGPQDLAPDSYVLEVRGNITGTSGGSYAGVLNLSPASPVPEPGSLALALTGGALLIVRLRKHKDRSPR